MTELAEQPETGTGELHLDLGRRLVAEALGTGLLRAAAVSPFVRVATGASLVGLILMFGGVSGAHFNPVVTLVDRLFGTITTHDASAYIAAQIIGGCV